MYKKIKHKIGVFIILCSILVTSCITTKKYIAPKTESIYLFRLDSLNPKGENISELNWKSFFKDELLRNYIDSALVNNYNNQIAFKNIQAFEALLKKARFGYFPTLDLSSDIQRQKQSNNSQSGGSSSITQYSLSGNFSWEADTWGKITSQKLASKAHFLQSITAQKVLQTALISNIANTYYQLLEADKQNVILKKTVILREQSVHTITKLKKAGQSNSLAVSQVEAQLSQAKVLLTSVKNTIFNLENALVLLIGKPITPIKRASLDSQFIPEAFLISMPVKILSNRPDVKEAELEFRYYFENHNVAIASMYPAVRLSANLGYQSVKSSSWFKSESFFSTLMGGITAPVLNSKSLRTNKKVTKIEMEQSLLRFQQKVLEASIEVSNVLNDFEAESKTLIALEEQEVLLTKSFKDSKKLLEYGLANYLDVLNAQENLLNIQLQYVQMASQKLQTATLVYKALGGGVN